MRKQFDFGSYLPTQRDNRIIIAFGDIHRVLNKHSSSTKDLETQILASVNNQNLI